MIISNLVFENSVYINNTHTAHSPLNAVIIFLLLLSKSPRTRTDIFQGRFSPIYKLCNN